MELGVLHLSLNFPRFFLLSTQYYNLQKKSIDAALEAAAKK